MGFAIDRQLFSGALRPVVFVCLFFYFAFHAFHGERGLFALFRNEHQIEEASEELRKMRHQRMVLEKRVKGLRANALDLDLLDEQARSMLGLAKKTEIILVWPEGQEAL